LNREHRNFGDGIRFVIT